MMLVRVLGRTVASTSEPSFVLRWTEKPIGKNISISLRKAVMKRTGLSLTTVQSFLIFGGDQSRHVGLPSHSHNAVDHVCDWGLILVLIHYLPHVIVRVLEVPVEICWIQMTVFPWHLVYSSSWGQWERDHLPHNPCHPGALDHKDRGDVLTQPWGWATSRWTFSMFNR